MRVMSIQNVYILFGTLCMHIYYCIYVQFSYTYVVSVHVMTSTLIAGTLKSDYSKQIIFITIYVIM
jgi:hypothetical protein